MRVRPSLVGDEIRLEKCFHTEERLAVLVEIQVQIKGQTHGDLRRAQG